MTNSDFLSYLPSFGPSTASDEQLRSYVNTLKAQEGGAAPDADKIRQNMFWHRTNKPNTHPMNTYFDALARNGDRVLENLKRRVPGAFGLPVKAGHFSVGGLDIKKQTAWIAGGGLIAVAVLAVAYNRNS